jgi:Xaa-Pro aminopeptidase
VRFLHWVTTEAPKGGVDELSAQAKLREFRDASGVLKDLSFDTISGAGPNGAIIHYRCSEETNRPLELNSLYLVDSGGQYADGTTDVTRTVAIGEPSEEMRDRFTRVLQGHIGIDTARFPPVRAVASSTASLAGPLWEGGLDYAHGTGHGVGSFLSVHEGPQRITFVGSSQSGADEPLQPGMILSNEPGYYKPGAYGIRIENLVLVVPVSVEGAEKEMLAFETLTFAPIDRALIRAEMLTAQERVWVDAYHACVLQVIAPQLEGDVLAWLEEQCRPLG